MPFFFSVPDQLKKKVDQQYHKLLIILVLVFQIACTPRIYPAREQKTSCRITENAYITADGTKLPLKTWQPDDQMSQAVIIAVHGFNDYSNFFQQPGQYFSKHQIISYAYDQRGFGQSPNRGLWAGVETYKSDLECLIQQVKNRHSSLPVYLLGESMGGAVVITLLSQSDHLPVAGNILVAPAIWGRQTMPWYQDSLLWLLSHTFPWMMLTGESLEIQPSDNIEMLTALSRDPWVIKETRIETVYGLVNLMDQAFSGATTLPKNTLFLYGEKDEIIPRQPTLQFLSKLAKTEKTQPVIAFYPNGYHMLLRDLQAKVLMNDIDHWINTQNTSLPSHADRRATEIISLQKKQDDD